jgi:hypothetical protein
MYNVGMAEERPSDIHELHAKMQRLALPECASCGGNDWLQPTDLPALIPLTENETGLFKGRGIEAVVAICERCGFIRWHSAQVLRRVKEGGGNGR